MKTEHHENRMALRLESIGVAYQRISGFFRREKFWALKDVSFNVFHGETLGIIGRNGVGKSTIMKLLAGIILPDKGQVLNYGVTASLLSLQAGFVLTLTGRENAILGGMMLGLSKGEMLVLMDNIYAYADIGTFFDQPVNSYSSGMRARLGFSVAIHIKPDIILLDEVMGVGDELFKKKSTKTIKDLIRSDQSVVLVSHSPALHRELCDRLIWIEEGVVRGAGPVETVLEDYLQYLKEIRT